MIQVTEPHPQERSSDQAKDPVCGMSVTMSPEARQANYDGETFYFCSDKCQTRFEADPIYYASGTASDHSMTPKAGTQYTCPMPVSYTHLTLPTNREV